MVNFGNMFNNFLTIRLSRRTTRRGGQHEAMDGVGNVCAYNINVISTPHSFMAKVNFAFCWSRTLIALRATHEHWESAMK